MSPEEAGRLQALSAPPLTAEQVESAARILAGIDHDEVAA